MEDVAESSRAQASSPHNDDDIAEAEVSVDSEYEAHEQKKEARERKLDTKRKRIRFLNGLLRELDITVYMHLIAIYHLDCSFFWLFIKAVMHACLLTPIPDTTLQQPPMEPQPFLPILLFNFGINFILHMSYPSPSAGEETRGYLHGGLMIDFIGQQGPTSKWKLAGMDILVLVLQLIMVSVHVKRRELKKKLAKFSTGSTGNEENAGTATTEDAGVTETNAADETMAENAARGQEADDEERGVLHRSDTLSDIGANPDEEEHALLSASDGSRPDALELLTSGQCVIGEFTLIDTLIQEYKNYAEHRSTQTEGSTGAATETLRRLHTLRTNFGVAGG